MHKTHKPGYCITAQKKDNPAMPKKLLIFPCYCNHCRHLSFIAREGAPGRYRMLDFIGGAWKQHSCAQVHPETINQLVDSHRFEDVSAAPETIPFRYQGESTAKRRESLTMGVIVKLDVNNHKQTADVVTPKNQLLNIRILDFTRPLYAGRALNLKKAIKVGKGKYRLEKTDILTPDQKSLSRKKSSPEPFYQILLHARDQEKLETFINRLLTTCKNARILPTNIIPLPVETEDNEQIFKREIHLPLNTELLLQIEKLTLPESIQISVRHD